MTNLDMEDRRQSGSIHAHFNFEDIPWSSPEVASKIVSRRKRSPDGKLFFDRLLAIADVDGLSLYPPTAPSGLRRLLGAIEDSQVDRLQQDCLFYYLKRDYDLSEMEDVREQDRRESGEEAESRAKSFARDRCMSKIWTTFIDGYHALDNAEWSLGVKNLINPAITQINFLPEIIAVLSKDVSPPSLAMRLVHSLSSTGPLEVNPSPDGGVKLLSLASSTSLIEAFGYIRDQTSPENRKRMRDSLWCWMLGFPRIPCGAGQQGAQTQLLKELLHLPLEQEEHDHLIEFLTRPPRGISPMALSALHDLVTLRLVHQGQYAEAIQLDKESSGSAGTDTDRQRRREMVREFISVLPAVQRRALAVEDDARAQRRQKEATKKAQKSISIELDDDGDIVDPNAPLADSVTQVNDAMDVSALRQSTSFANLSSSIGTINQTPKPQSPSSRPHSPFSGPPRFPSARLDAPGMRQRVLSGTPFALPRTASQGGSSVRGSPVPSPKPSMRVINDDDAPIEFPTRRRLRGPSSTAQQEDLPHSPTPQPPRDPSPEPSLHPEDHDMDGHSEVEKARSPSPSPPRKASKPPQRRSARAVSTTSTVPDEPTSTGPEPTKVDSGDKSGQNKRKLGPRSFMPGSYDPQAMQSDTADTASRASAQDTENAEEEKEAEHKTPRKRSGPAPTRQAPQTGERRSRMTRSTSRALLDDQESHDELAPPMAKRTRRAARETSVMSTMSTATQGTTAETPRTTRRTTRASRASTAQPSELGSPTPSIATMSDFGRMANTTMTARRKARESSANLQTPRRSTRAKK